MPSVACKKPFSSVGAFLESRRKSRNDNNTERHEHTRIMSGAFSVSRNALFCVCILVSFGLFLIKTVCVFVETTLLKLQLQQLRVVEA